LEPGGVVLGNPLRRSSRQSGAGMFSSKLAIAVIAACVGIGAAHSVAAEQASQAAAPAKHFRVATTPGGSPTAVARSGTSRAALAKGREAVAVGRSAGGPARLANQHSRAVPLGKTDSRARILTATPLTN